MSLPIEPPLTPMLARLEERLPVGEDWRYEPKWDGFRALVFRDGPRVDVISRNGQPLTRYFPELQEVLREALPRRCVVDGEIILLRDGRLDFDALLQRIHPAQSRITRLSKETPVSFVLFDLLAEGDNDLRERAFDVRRKKLEARVKTGPHVFVTPQTDDLPLAEAWFLRLESAGLDGIVAKKGAGCYLPGERDFVKVKHARTCDCVVGGYRPSKTGKGFKLGSLLLGLYDDEGRLLHVGATVSFPAALRREMEERLVPLQGGPSFHPDHAPGQPSRWSRGADRSWVSVRPELVCEVAFDHLQGHRFRHAARFLRWRPDKRPEECTYAQLAAPNPLTLEEAVASAHA